MSVACNTLRHNYALHYYVVTLMAHNAWVAYFARVCRLPILTRSGPPRYNISRGSGAVVTLGLDCMVKMHMPDLGIHKE